MERAEKIEELALLKASLRASKIALCADYSGITVGEMTTFRKDLRNNGSQGRVIKNTLGKIAFNDTLASEGSESEVTKFLATFKGPSLLIHSAVDPVSPTKVVAKFMEATKKLTIKGAFLDGVFVDADGVKALSKLPGKEELLGMLLRLISAPATSLVRLLEAPGTQMVRVIDAQREKIEKNV